MSGFFSMFFRTLKLQERSGCVIVNPKEQTRHAVHALVLAASLQTTLESIDTLYSQWTIEHSQFCVPIRKSENMASNAEDSDESPVAEAELRLTNGSARIVRASDGEKDCYSLLLTEELVRIVNTIKRLVTQRRSRERAAFEAQREASNTEQEVQNLQEELDRARTRSQSRAVSPRLEAAKTQLASTRQHHKEIDDGLKLVEQDLALRRMFLEDILEGALYHANLMEKDYPPATSSKDQKLEQMDSKGSSPNGNTDPQTPPLSPGAQELQHILVNFQKARDVYIQAEIDFANRKQVEEENLAQRKRHLAEGVAREGKTEFDLEHVAQEMRLTRDLISATEQFEQWQEYAHAHEVYTASERIERGLDPDPDEWDFAGHYKEPSNTSDPHERPNDPETDTRIEGWREGMGSAEGYPDDQSRMDVDLDEWDADTVGLSESCSMIDDSSRRAKIDEWREMCGLHDGH